MIKDILEVREKLRRMNDRSCNVKMIVLASLQQEIRRLGSCQRWCYKSRPTSCLANPRWARWRSDKSRPLLDRAPCLLAKQDVWINAGVHLISKLYSELFRAECRQMSLGRDFAGIENRLAPDWCNSQNICKKNLNAFKHRAIILSPTYFPCHAIWI